jgi:hypothetical protein
MTASPQTPGLPGRPPWTRPGVPSLTGPQIGEIGALIAVGPTLLGTTCSASQLDYTGYTVSGDSITIDTPHPTGGVAGLIHLITTSGTARRIPGAQR